MGIVNVTPDSFSDGGRLAGPEAAVQYALQQFSDGASIVDVGGESTRPGSDVVSGEDEIARVLPVIEGVLAREPQACLSVDTRKAVVAAEALRAGARIVNDVSGGADPDMFAAVADAGAGLVLMHMQGDPKTMQDDPHYDDVVDEVRTYLYERLEAAAFAGVERERLCVDPGIGFGKTLEHNLALLRSIETFASLGTPILAGVSRKRFLGELTDVPEPADRFDGTAAAVAWCASHGVDIVRVHDVPQIVRVVRVIDAIVGAA